jgi:hypothetical protein
MILLLLLALAQDKRAKAIQESIDAVRKPDQFVATARYNSKGYAGKIVGLIRKEVHLPLEGPEIYAKHSNVLIKAANGKVLAPNQVDSQSDDGRAISAFRNPWVMLSEIEASMQQINPEKRPEDAVDGVGCELYVVTVPVEMRKAIIKSMLANIASPIPMPAPDQMIDYEKTLCRYLVWLKKADRSLVQFKFELEIARNEKKGGMPLGGLGGFDPSTWTADITVGIALKDATPKPVPKEAQTKLALPSK